MAVSPVASNGGSNNSSTTAIATKDKLANAHDLEQLQELHQRHQRHRQLGNVVLIGELFKRAVLSEHVMHRCMFIACVAFYGYPFSE